MELLSLALTLAPSAQSLAEILGTWRRCEEEMEGLKSTALRQERAFDTGRAEELPGGFGFDDREWDAAETKQAQSRRTGTATYEEEAPVSLFEMARGAAGSLRKSAFPLSAGLEDRKHRSSPSQGSDERPESAQDGDRVRKRDMVSNMVTSGLVSGMGWVLGAQPADRPGQQQQWVMIRISLLHFLITARLDHDQAQIIAGTTTIILLILLRDVIREGTRSWSR
jgi:protein transport protein SEC39